MNDLITVTIESLLTSLPENEYRFQGDPRREIRAVTWDYQKIVEGAMYFCLEDEEFQEHHIFGNSLKYWKDAVGSGAVCLVAGKGKITKCPPQVSLLEVENVNQSMAQLSRAFYGDPLSGMKIVGITGTNGKTTTSQMLDSIFLQTGKQTGVIGTIGVFYPSGKQEASHLSNPMATELFAMGSRMREEQVEFLTMEVTSHGMAFDRNHAIDFDIGIFTNLTQDHLDYHGTIEAYKKSKLKHFERLGHGEKKAYGIVNIDDATGQEFIDVIDKHLRVKGKAEVLTFGIRNKDADLVVYPKRMTGGFSEFDVFMRGNHLSRVKLPMPGLFNIYNAMAAFGAAFALGISIERIVDGLESVMKVDGRFEKVDCEANFDIYVDYAHTPDSLSKILQEIRGLTKKRVIVVFGCGGDRDRTKRPEMGGIAAEIADICIVTSDNPRTEDPESIIRDIVSGIPEDTKTHTIEEVDRKQAIHLAMETASFDDSVLIAGKGHETYQIIGRKTYPFFDRKVVQEYFQSRQDTYSRAWIEIDLKNLHHNFQTILKDKPADLKIMAVVKDNGLGHGIVDVSREALNAGCDYLGVACLSEAITVRKEFEEIPILVLGERPDEEISLCIQHNLSIQIQSRKKAELIGRISSEHHTETRVHFKVDTGMGRYGVRWDQAAETFKSIRSIPGIEPEGIMTHFARSDEANKDYANLQWQRFQEVLTELDRDKLLPPLIHSCNSGGYLDLPHAHGSLVRIGILPTGVYPSKVCRRIDIDGQRLEPVMSVKTRISFLKTLVAGDSVGYGMHYQADGEVRIAILPMGYGDGYPRLRNTGFVLIRGQEAPIVGGNGLDAIMVDVTGIPNAEAGDEVVLLGKQKDKEITATMIADWADTVTYDILSRWSKRMDRQFV
ncbi:MAG: UDP-N-acetylmuramoyl-L-alanyl-D-glutamate--2,6-diaminopimelate ligase [Proteobacteria bacterium]|nr:UDP-N-acetylmuramoyl-L-alanyl-D-glutamate--2,6-diaminopimelate ligase [Pseudomonadota bacterium]